MGYHIRPAQTRLPVFKNKARLTWDTSLVLANFESGLISPEDDQAWTLEGTLLNIRTGPGIEVRIADEILAKLGAGMDTAFLDVRLETATKLRSKDWHFGGHLDGSLFYLPNQYFSIYAGGGLESIGEQTVRDGTNQATIDLSSNLDPLHGHGLPMVSLCKKITEHAVFKRFIIGVIIIAGIHVGVETYKDFANRHRTVLDGLDGCILFIFTTEIILKVIACGNRPFRFFRDPWNLFDFTIVAACLLEPILPGNAAFLPALRLVRILRVLRIITAIQTYGSLLRLSSAASPRCSMFVCS